ncbi:MAG: hypothetical protein JNM58_11590 [Xanthomonadaceae bacterium]|nr:hypothetical protein [Xanthomonadaceae bacterium]
MSNQGKKGVDPFRQLLIGEVDKLGTQHGQDWGNRLRSEHAMEMGAQGPKGGITAQMLIQQRSQLKKVMSVGTPWANNLEIVRDGTHTTHGSGAEFTDFVQQTRAHLSTIASTTSGQSLFQHIGNANKRKVTIQDAGSQPGIRQASSPLDRPNSMLQEPTMLKGIPVPLQFSGTGSDAVVSHHTDIGQRWPQLALGQGGMTRQELRKETADGPIALGHELIHAMHAVRGMRQRDDSTATIAPEEHATIGPADGSTPHFMPTENSLRRDLNAQVHQGSGFLKPIPMRTTYGKKDL